QYGEFPRGVKRGAAMHVTRNPALLKDLTVPRPSRPCRRLETKNNPLSQVLGQSKSLARPGRPWHGCVEQSGLEPASDYYVLRITFYALRSLHAPLLPLSPGPVRPAAGPRRVREARRRPG